MQFRRRRRTHARRITQTYFLAHGSEIEVELSVVVGGIAFQIECAAAGASRQLIDMHPVACKSQRTVHLTQTARQASIVRRSVLDLDGALRKWLAERPSYQHVDRS